MNLPSLSAQSCAKAIQCFLFTYGNLWFILPNYIQKFLGVICAFLYADLQSPSTENVNIVRLIQSSYVLVQTDSSLVCTYYIFSKDFRFYILYSYFSFFNFNKINGTVPLEGPPVVIPLHCQLSYLINNATLICSGFLFFLSR